MEWVFKYSSLRFVFKGLNTNIKWTLQKALIQSVMTYACPACEFAADTHLSKVQRPAKHRTMAIFQSVHRPAKYMWLSKFLTYKTSLQNYAGSGRKSYENTTIKMLSQHCTTQSPNTGNIRSLNLRAVKKTWVRMSKLPLCYSLKAWCAVHKRVVTEAVYKLYLTLNIPRGVLWGPKRVIFCDPAVTITTNLLLIFVSRISWR